MGVFCVKINAATERVKHNLIQGKRRLGRFLHAGDVFMAILLYRAISPDTASRLQKVCAWRSSSKLPLAQLKHGLVCTVISLFCVSSLSACGSLAPKPSVTPAPLTLEQRQAWQATGLVVATVDFQLAPDWVQQQAKRHGTRALANLQASYQQSLTQAAKNALRNQGWRVLDMPLQEAQQHGLPIVTLSLHNSSLVAPDIEGPLVDHYVPNEHGQFDVALTLTQGDTILLQVPAKTLQVQSGIAGQLNFTNRSLNQQAFNRTLNHYLKNTLSSGRS